MILAYCSVNQNAPRQCEQVPCILLEYATFKILLDKSKILMGFCCDGVHVTGVPTLRRQTVRGRLTFWANTL